MGGATRKSKKPKESELSPVDSTVTPSDLSLDPPPKQLSFDLPFGTGETHSLGLLDFRDSISPQDWIFFSLPKEMMTTIVFSLLPSNFRKNQITPFLSTCKMAYHLFVPFVKYKKSPYQIAASLVGYVLYVISLSLACFFCNPPLVLVFFFFFSFLVCSLFVFFFSFSFFVQFVLFFYFLSFFPHFSQTVSLDAVFIPLCQSSNYSIQIM